MSKLTGIVIIAILAVATAASAQAPAGDKPPPGGAGKAPPAAKPEAPKPAPELQQYKGMIGTWKCEGKGTMGGHEMKMTGTYKAQWDMDNFWVLATFEGKAAGMPMTHKGHDIYGYDSGKKQYIVMGYDNMGGFSMATSKGWEGDKQEWAGKGNMMGQESDVKWSVTKKGDKEITISGGMGTDTFEETCKK